MSSLLTIPHTWRNTTPPTNLKKNHLFRSLTNFEDITMIRWLTKTMAGAIGDIATGVKESLPDSVQEITEDAANYYQSTAKSYYMTKAAFIPETQQAQKMELENELAERMAQAQAEREKLIAKYNIEF